MFNVFFPCKSCCLWDNMIKFVTTRWATDNRIIRRTCFACRMTKATETHSEYERHSAHHCQHWLHERAWILSYIYIICLVQNQKQFFISSPHHSITVLKLPGYYMHYALPTIPSLLVVHTRLSYIQRALFLILRLQENDIFVLLSPLRSSTYIQQNSINPTSTGLDKCQDIEYSALSDSSCTDLSSYR